MKPGTTTENQSEVIALLADPSTHGGAVPERVDTHAAIVFLVNDMAYKLKRAVWYPFLDFTTRRKRYIACEAEVRLNRRTAPDFYLGCEPVARQPDGSLVLGGDGEPVDWLVVMRRFDQKLLFDRMAARGALKPAHMVDLADEIAAFHESAAIRTDFGGAAAMRWIIDDDIAELAAMPETFGATGVHALQHLSEEALRDNTALLDERRRRGYVRHCHGDLHLRNIFLWHGRPTLFDCLEFDEELATTDVLYDLAFLLMDLEHIGRRDLANVLFNRYLQRTGDICGLAVLPLFLSCRAAIRAKVAASAAMHQRLDAQAEALRNDAREYMKLSTGFLTPHAPQLIAIGGESGSGKSTVAALVAPRLGESPGALILRSDVTRKRLFGCVLEDALPEKAYSPAATKRTFSRIIANAKRNLAAGLTVICDAVYAEPAERDALEAAARAAGVPFSGFWLDAPLEARIARVAGRSSDASDADVAFLRDNPRRETGAMRWTRIEASGSAAKVATTLLESLKSPIPCA